MQRLAAPQQARAGTEAAVALALDVQRHRDRPASGAAPRCGNPPARLRRGDGRLVERIDAGLGQFNVQAAGAGEGRRGQQDEGKQAEEFHRRSTGSRGTQTAPGKEASRGGAAAQTADHAAGAS